MEGGSIREHTACNGDVACHQICFVATRSYSKWPPKKRPKTPSKMLPALSFNTSPRRYYLYCWLQHCRCPRCWISAYNISSPDILVNAAQNRSSRHLSKNVEKKGSNNIINNQLVDGDVVRRQGQGRHKETKEELPLAMAHTLQ